jgi:hypothetical protein
MNPTFLFGLLLGMVAALMLNLGKGVQKQKVHVFLEGRKMFRAPHRRDLGIWLFGMALTTTAALPYSLALRFSESPSAISAMTGIGLVGLAIYAIKAIGEKASRTDALGVGLVVLGTSALGYMGSSQQPLAREFDDRSLVVVLAVVFGLAAATAIGGWVLRRIHGVAFGLAAGLILGTTVFLGDAALVRAGGDFFGQFSNPYPYVALGVGPVALIVTQLGFLRGRALEVVPAVSSAMIVTPLGLERVVYGTVPGALQLGVVAVIVVGVVLLSLGAAGAAAAGKNRKGTVPALSSPKTP